MAVAEKPKFTFLVFVVLLHNCNVLLLIVPLSVSLRIGFCPQRIVYRLMAAALPCVCLSITRTSRLIILLGRVRRYFSSVCLVQKWRVVSRPSTVLRKNHIVPATSIDKPTS